MKWPADSRRTSFALTVSTRRWQTFRLLTIYVQFILYTLHHYHHRSRPSHHTKIKFIGVAKEGGIGSVLLISEEKMYATSFKKKILQFTLYFTLWLYNCSQPKICKTGLTAVRIEFVFDPELCPGPLWEPPVYLIVESRSVSAAELPSRCWSNRSSGQTLRTCVLCFLVFSTVCLEFAAANSSDQRLCRTAFRSDLKLFSSIRHLVNTDPICR